MCLLLLLRAQTQRWPLLCIGHMVIIPSFLWHSAMGLICSFTDQILGICWMAQNYVGRFYRMSFIHLCLLATLVPERFVLCCPGIFGGPPYVVVLQAVWVSLLYYLLEEQVPYFSLNLVYCTAITYFKR